MSWIIIDKLTDIILQNREGCIVEIGSSVVNNSSTHILAKYAKAQDVKFYSCDIKAINSLFENHIVFVGESEKFMKQFNDIPSIVLLDGCHDSNIVEKEVNYFINKIIEGGIIFMHDTYPPSERYLQKEFSSNCYKVRQKLEKRKDINCFTWPYTAWNCGLTMIMKKEKNRPYYKI